MHSGSVSKELSGCRQHDRRRDGVVPRKIGVRGLAGRGRTGIIRVMADDHEVEQARAAPTPVGRFVVRPQAGGFKVIDIWTGETAVIAMTAQDDMSEEDAVHTALLLNRRAVGGDRSVPQ